MGKYAELILQFPELGKCFFAFNKEEYAEGLIKHGLIDSEVVHAGYGLYGTREDIKLFAERRDARKIDIASQCTPQEIYDYEYYNHECSYTGDDSEALEIVKDYYGEDVTITRKFGERND